WNSGTRTFTPGGTPTDSVRVRARRATVNSNALPTFFLRMLGVNSFDVVTESIAQYYVTGNGCILALNTSANNAINLANNVSLLSNCGVYSNSSSSSAIHLNNNATVSGPTYLVGNPTVDNGAALNGSPNLTGQTAATDPYGTVSAGTPGTCISGVVTGGSI